MARMTDEQIKTTVAAMQMAEPLKAKLVREALAGSPNARFVVYAAMKRQTDPQEG